MSVPAVVFDDVSKKFNRGERFTSLRDLIPAIATSWMKRAPASELQAQQFWALRNVSFEVQQGEALGIIGPNGAGKSTALKVLTRILRPDTGRSVVRGRVGALVEIAAGFHPNLTGRENVFMQGAIMGMKRAEIARKFDEIVDFAGVAEFIDTPIKRYSSGMNARLGFAVAAHLDPDVLLIDEVLSVGDIAFQEKCYERMQRFVRSGIAVVFVSHNLSAISNLCSKVLVLRHGEVHTLAPTDDAIRAYAALVEERGPRGDGRSDVLVKMQDAAGQRVDSIAAGQRLHVRSHVVPPVTGVPYLCELQVKHLETSATIFRCQSHAVGCAPVVSSGEGIEIDWAIDANLARGHYSVMVVLLNEQRAWVVTSSPALLTVDERHSERAVVYLNPSCTMRTLAPAS